MRALRRLIERLRHPKRHIAQAGPPLRQDFSRPVTISGPEPIFADDLTSGRPMTPEGRAELEAWWAEARPRLARTVDAEFARTQEGKGAAKEKKGLDAYLASTVRTGPAWTPRDPHDGGYAHMDREAEARWRQEREGRWTEPARPDET